MFLKPYPCLALFTNHDWCKSNHYRFIGAKYLKFESEIREFVKVKEKPSDRKDKEMGGKGRDQGKK